MGQQKFTVNSSPDIYKYKYKQVSTVHGLAFLALHSDIYLIPLLIFTVDQKVRNLAQHLWEIENTVKSSFLLLTTNKLRYVTSQVRSVSGSTVVNGNWITNCEAKRFWINYVCGVTSTCNLEPLALTTMEFEADRPLLRLETMIGFGGKQLLRWERT